MCVKEISNYIKRDLKSTLYGSPLEALFDSQEKKLCVPCDKYVLLRVSET